MSGGGGKFFVARSIWNHPEFAPAEFSGREAWIWMISEAAWKPLRVRAGRIVIDIDRGEFCYSLRFMAQAWRWSKDRVRRYLNRLAASDMIATRSATDAATGQLAVTICNYDNFRGAAHSSATESATTDGRDPRQQRDGAATNKKNLKKENNSKKEYIGGGGGGGSGARARRFAIRRYGPRASTSPGPQ